MVATDATVTDATLSREASVDVTVAREAAVDATAVPSDARTDATSDR